MKQHRNGPIDFAFTRTKPEQFEFEINELFRYRFITLLSLSCCDYRNSHCLKDKVCCRLSSCKNEPKLRTSLE